MLVKQLGHVLYAETYQAMQDFTAKRAAETADELWLCQHPPVFTQGLAGLATHVLNPGAIPVIATNRGGQVTFHGPGQVMALSKSMFIALKNLSYKRWLILALRGTVSAMRQASMFA